LSRRFWAQIRLLYSLDFVRLYLTPTLVVEF
jgi:hypothetical protein